MLASSILLPAGPLPEHGWTTPAIKSSTALSGMKRLRTEIANAAQMSSALILKATAPTGPLSGPRTSALLQLALDLNRTIRLFEMLVGRFAYEPVVSPCSVGRLGSASSNRIDLERVLRTGQF